MSIAAYKKTIKETANPRQIERRIMSRVTGRLQDSVSGFDTTESKSERYAILGDGLREALGENLKLWMAFKADLLRDDNQLPDELRANLMSLAIFVEGHTARVMAGEDRVTPLIEVNTSIMGSLSGQTAEAS